MFWNVQDWSTTNISFTAYDLYNINESHLQPNKKWSIPVHIIYRPEGHGPAHGGTVIAVRSPVHHNKANPPQVTELEVTVVNSQPRQSALCMPHPTDHFSSRISRQWPSRINILYLLAIIMPSLWRSTLVRQTPGADYCTVMLSNTTTKSYVSMLPPVSQQTAVIIKTSLTQPS
jgi:hypothetical protein